MSKPDAGRDGQEEVNGLRIERAHHATLALQAVAELAAEVAVAALAGLLAGLLTASMLMATRENLTVEQAMIGGKDHLGGKI